MVWRAVPTPCVVGRHTTRDHSDIVFRISETPDRIIDSMLHTYCQKTGAMLTAPSALPNADILNNDPPKAASFGILPVEGSENWLALN